MVLAALKEVFRKPAYILLASISTLVLFVLATWLPNIGLIMSVITSTDVPLTLKISLPISLIGSIATNFTALSAVYTIAIAVLFGMDMAMITYSLRQKFGVFKQGGIKTGLFGLLAGVLGAGCASCGSLILTSILPLIGGSSLLAFLPLRGGEFGILAVVLLFVSLYATARQINQPAVCVPNLIT